MSGYKKVEMPDGKTWLAENLNCNVAGSVCYDNDPANCAKYGRLYNWETAKKACSGGWHLPSDAEWEALFTSVGGVLTAGTKLKAKSGWHDNGNENGNGTDDFEFSALPGGYGISDGDGRFSYVGYGGHWWTATATAEYGNEAYYWGMDYSNELANRNHDDRRDLFSVRCLQD